MKLVIVSGSKNNTKMYENIIDKVVLKTEYHYEYYKFDANNKELDGFLSKHEQGMLYVIENSKKINALNVMKKIRLEHTDTTSFIIIIDFCNIINQNDLDEIFIFNNALMNDQKTYEKKLTKVLEQLLYVYKSKDKALQYKYKGIEYKIFFSNILQIERVRNSKLCKIICKIGEYYINKSLKEIKDMLDDRFIRPDRYKIINEDNYIKYDTNTKKAYFEMETTKKEKETQFLRNQV